MALTGNIRHLHKYLTVLGTIWAVYFFRTHVLIFPLYFSILIILIILIVSILCVDLTKHCHCVPFLLSYFCISCVVDNFTSTLLFKCFWFNLIWLQPNMLTNLLSWSLVLNWNTMNYYLFKPLHNRAAYPPFDSNTSTQTFI